MNPKARLTISEDGTTNYQGWRLYFPGATITESDGTVTITISGGGGGTSNHAALSHLGWTSSAHTGTASRFAVFDSGGAAAYLAYPTSGITTWSGTAFGNATISAPLTYSGGTLAISDFVGDSGSGGVRGTVPAPSVGQGAAQYYLSASGTWQPIPTGFVNVYPDPVVSSDISGYKVLLTNPSTGSETTLTAAATGTGDSLMASFATGTGIPGVTLIQHGTYLFHFHVATGAANQIGRLKFEIYTCAVDGSGETLRSSGYSDSFSDTVQDLNTDLTDATGYVVGTTDRIVLKLYAARVSGPATCNVTVYFNGLTRNPHIITTLGGATPSIIGAEPAITAGTTSQYWRGDKSWQTLNKSAVGLGSVENTALSTWAGTTNLTVLGTVVTGTWHGSTVGAGYGGTGLTSYNAGDLLYATGSTTLAKLAIGTTNYLLASSGSAPTWAAPGDLAISGGSVQATQSRGLRETSGPTTLTMGSVTAGQLLSRVGTTVSGITLAAGTGLTSATDGSGNITISYSETSSAEISTALSTLVGLGTKGNVTFNGSAVSGFTLTIVGSTATYVLNDSALVVPDWNVVTVDTSTYTIVITTKGMVPKVLRWVQSGANDCIIDWPASSASTGTAGSGATSLTGARLLGGSTGGAGRGSAGVGTVGVAAAGVALGSQGGSGGKGNNGLTNGGAGGALTRRWARGGRYGDMCTILLSLGAEDMGASTATRYGLSGGTGGGSGGTSGGTTSGGGGGGGGDIVFLCRSIEVSIATAGRLIFRSVAGNGGNAVAVGNVSSGGGGGGAPGDIVLIAGWITGVIRIETTGGNGGNGAIAGIATAANGGDGGPGGDSYALYGGITSDGVSGVTAVSTPGTGGTAAGSGSAGATGAAGTTYLQVIQ